MPAYRYEIGALYRGSVRSNLDRLGLLYTENRTLVDSTFFVHANSTDRNFRIFHNGIAALQAEFEAEDRAREAAEAAFKAAWRWWNPRTWSRVAIVLWLYVGIILGLPLAIFLIVSIINGASS